MRQDALCHMWRACDRRQDHHARHWNLRPISEHGVQSRALCAVWIFYRRRQAVSSTCPRWPLWRNGPKARCDDELRSPPDRNQQCGLVFKGVRRGDAHLCHGPARAAADALFQLPNRPPFHRAARRQDPNGRMRHHALREQHALLYRRPEHREQPYEPPNGPLQQPPPRAATEPAAAAQVAATRAAGTTATATTPSATVLFHKLRDQDVCARCRGGVL